MWLIEFKYSRRSENMMFFVIEKIWHWHSVNIETEFKTQFRNKIMWKMKQIDF